MHLTNDDVQEILRILDSSPYDELELETDRFKLTLRRAASNVGVEGGWTREDETRGTPKVEGAVAETVPEANRDSTAAPAQSADGLIDICAQLPGTFYRAPKPGDPPFVDVGSEVKEDTVICIIETMKLMNTAHAGHRGRVVEICAGNAELVQAGRVLMRLEPEGA